MTGYKTDTLNCRVNRATKVYQSVYDSVPQAITIPVGTTFTSSKQYESDKIGYVHITIDGGDYTGLWCPIGSVQTRLVSNDVFVPSETSDVPNEDRIKLIVKKPEVLVYPSSDSTFGVPAGVKTGDTIVADQKVSVVNNGVYTTKYHILSTTAEDQTIIGWWVNLNSSITDATAVAGMSVQAPKVNNGGIMTLAWEDITSLQGSEHGNGYSGAPAKQDATIPEYSSTGENASDNTAANSKNVFERLAQRIGDGVGHWFYGDTDMQFSEEEIAEIYAAMNDYAIGSGSTVSIQSPAIGRMNFVHGMPFQYTHLTDRRNGVVSNFGKPSAYGRNMDTADNIQYGDEDQYGRSFAKEFAFNVPIAIIVPGKPHFLEPVTIFNKNPDNETKTDFISLFNSGDSENDGLTRVLQKLADKGGDFQYYTLQIDTDEYFRFVNSMSWASAVFMQLSGMWYHGQPVLNFDWSRYNSSTEQDFTTFEDLLGMGSGVSVAFDPQSSFSNTIQNQTQESQLASMFNQLSSQAREIDFIAGYTASGMNWINNNAEQAVSSINMDGAFAGLENAFNRVKAWLTNSAKGMNVRFPEIWSESNSSPSYEMECHFIAPYATPFCIWRYVLCPFYHMFCLAAPKSTTNASQYEAPFIIKGYSKGYFNVEMGLIDSITWKRFGDGDMISEGGIPTQIDVTITFKDLYHALTITHRGDGGISKINQFVNNAGLMEMIGTLSGVNMSRIDYESRITLLLSAASGMMSNLKGDIRNSIQDRLRNIVRRMGITTLQPQF